uniref:Uncharacterized protein n=1 Tax=Romanomermis culicivorax TaxID=13658 RepID=A0A915KPP8_ROMCU
MNLVIRGSSEAWLKHIGHFVGKLGPILNNDEDVEAPTIFPHDVQSPNIFARIISEEAPNLIVAWNYPCHKKYERLSSVQLMEFLLASTFLVKARDENLVTWFLKMRLEVRPDIIISMADDNVNYCQMHIEIILKEKGLKEHQYVLKLLANHLENLQNYPGAEWEKIYNRMDYKEHPKDEYKAFLIFLAWSLYNS